MTNGNQPTLVYTSNGIAADKNLITKPIVLSGNVNAAPQNGNTLFASGMCKVYLDSEILNVLKYENVKMLKSQGRPPFNCIAHFQVFRLCLRLIKFPSTG